MKTAAQKRARDAKNPTVTIRGINTSTSAAARLISPDKPLTDKQRAFAKAWAEGDTIPNAVIRAGYAEVPAYGYRLAAMPNILAAYHAEKAKYEEACQMTRKKVMDGLLEAVEMAKLMSEPATMVAGWREVGKMLGYYEPTKQKIDISINGSVAMQQMSALSDADLLKLIQGQVGVNAPLTLAPPDETSEEDHPE